MIRVVNPTQLPAFPAAQGAEAVAGAVNDGKRYNNVSIVWVAGGNPAASEGGTAIVDLGVDALDCDFSVVQINNSGNCGPLNIVAAAGTNATVFVHPTTEIYKLGMSQGVSREHGGGSPNTEIFTQSYNIEDKYAIGTIVHNVTKDTYSRIDSWGVAKGRANTTMLSPPGGPGHDENDVYHFLSPVADLGVYNHRLLEQQNYFSYNYADPFKLVTTAFVKPGAPPIPNDICDIATGTGGQYDARHPPALIISPPPSVYNSGVSSRLQIKGTSEFDMQYIVRWRT